MAKEPHRKRLGSQRRGRGLRALTQALRVQWLPQPAVAPAGQGKGGGGEMKVGALPSRLCPARSLSCCRHRATLSLQTLYAFSRRVPAELLAAWLCVRLLALQGLLHPIWRLGLLEGASFSPLAEAGLAQHASLPRCPKRHPSACFPCLFLLGQMTLICQSVQRAVQAGGIGLEGKTLHSAPESPWGERLPPGYRGISKKPASSASAI